MKELSIEERAQRYDEAINVARSKIKNDKDHVLYEEDIADIFPELKESEDEKVEKAIYGMVYDSDDELWSSYDVSKSDVLAWLDKQGNTNETVNRDEFAQGVLKGAAINLITWIDYNAAEGNMCLSNTECKDIEDALVTGDWNRIYAYMKRKLEKQDKSTTIDIDKMVNEYANNNECGNEEFGKPVNCMIRAYRQGINDALNLSSGIEKQGGPKPADEVESKDYNRIDPHFGKPIDMKVKPKFHEGEWIISKNKKSTYQVIEVKRGIYVIRDNADNHEYHIGIEECEKSGKLWNISDAKDGDVLAEDTCIFIIQKLGDNSTAAKTYCTLYSDGDFDDGSILYFDIDSTKPATKEQRNALERAMADAGYTFDFEKKELKKIELKPDKTEPKFKVGDWVVWNNKYYKVNYNGCGYELIDQDGLHTSLEYGTVDENAHIFSITDAKDGDVLAFNDGHGNDCIELIKSITDKKIEFWFCLTNGNRYEVFDGITPYTNLVSREDATPATKEQCDALMKAMADAGWEFDFEKKELKKIEQKSATMSLDEAIEHCKEKSCGNNACALEHKQLERWLTELKELKEQKPAWSKEDKKCIRLSTDIIDSALHAGFCVQLDRDRCVDWLKSLKDRVQPKQEWGDEDEHRVKDTIYFLDTAKKHYASTVEIDACIDWLKSLRPQKPWKPSMDQLRCLLKYSEQNNYDGTILTSLYKDLKRICV